jgi:hypothetical protein
MPISKHADGTYVISCARGPKKCFYCGRDSEILCDFPMSWGGTCDKPCCGLCSKRIAPNTDYCQAHAKEK